MADHDQRLKVTLREFLGELVALRLPAWHGRFDFTSAEWLQQQLFLDPPRGKRHEVDLVVRVPLKLPIQSATQMLLHVEVESGDGVAGLRERMPKYHDYLAYQHGLLVLSLAVYLGVGLDGLGWDGVSEVVWEESLGTRRWPYLGLPALDGLAYVEGDNLLGVAFSSLMRVPDDMRAWLKARALQRLVEVELTTSRRFLLMDFVEAYLPLEGPHLDEYRRLLVTKEFSMILKIGKTTFELGKEEGLHQGERKVVRKLLKSKFGPLSAEVNALLDTMSVEKLDELAERLLKAESLAELGLVAANPGHVNGA